MDAQPLKVAHVIQHLGLGGAESFVLNLVREQRQRGVDAQIVLCGRTQPTRPIDDVPIVMMVRRPGPDLGLIVRMARFFRKKKFDIVHAHTAPGLVYGGLSAELARVPWIFTEHSSSSPSELYGKKRQFLNFLTRRARFVVTFDESLLPIVAERSHVKRERLLAIPNGITSAPTDGLSRFDAREVLGPTNDFVAVAIGELRSQKNYGLLIEVAALCAQRALALQFAIVGEGGERPAIEQKIADLGVTNVRLVGAYSNAQRLLAGADIFINTSVWEGMPIAILEAMGSGVPIVASDVGCVRSMVGDAGMICGLEATAFADALQRLMNDGEAFRSMQQAAVFRVQTIFNIQEVAKSYCRVYRRAMGEDSPAPN